MLYNMRIKEISNGFEVLIERDSHHHGQCVPDGDVFVFNDRRKLSDFIFDAYENKSYQLVPREE
jgi:hypothetical protein